MDAVTEFADACRERAFLAGVYSGTIHNDGEPFHLGQTEGYLVERALRAFENEQSILIHNPRPSPSVPLAIAAAYVISQDTRIKASDVDEESLRRGNGWGMLMFPGSGYVTKFDKFHYDRVVNPGASMLTRHTLSKLSETGQGWGLYTANDDFSFDFDRKYTAHGATFVDLSRPLWSERYFDRIEEYCENHPRIPTVFYTDEMHSAAELTCERLDIEPITITGELLATSDPPKPPQPGESDLTTHERILCSDIAAKHLTVYDEEFHERVPDLIEFKQKLAARDLSFQSVARAYNCLTQQACKPKYWDEQIAGSGFHRTIPEYLEQIREASDRTGGIGGDLLSHFARQATELQGYLNSEHALQNTVLQSVQKAGAEDDPVVFVTKNDAEAEALELAAESEGYTVPENVSFVGRQSVTPDMDARHIFVYPPFEESYLYEFPPSRSIYYLMNSMWGEYVHRNATDRTRALNVTHDHEYTGEGHDTADSLTYDSEELVANIQRHYEEHGFDLVDSADRAASDGASGGTTYHPDEFVVMRLDNGETVRHAPGAHVTTYDEGTFKVTRKAARSVEEGDGIVLLNAVSGDIFDLLLEDAKMSPNVQEDLDLIENWREMLTVGMDARDLNAADVLGELKERGSTLRREGTIENWCSGVTIAPGFRKDLRRTLLVFRPDLPGEDIETIERHLWRAIQHIRTLHRRIGRNVRRVIEAEANGTTTTNFVGDDINESMIRDITNDLERTTVLQIWRD
jgi:hypothetical protein